MKKSAVSVTRKLVFLDAALLHLREARDIIEETGDKTLYAAADAIVVMFEMRAADWQEELQDTLQ